MKEEEEYKITPMGSLGLLALGHIGIIKWREAVAKEAEEKKKKQKEHVSKEKK